MPCQKFHVHLRGFIDQGETKWKSLDGEYELSEQLKNFSEIAKKAQQEYIIEVFYKNNPASLFRPIPITNQESIAQENETQMTKAQILLKIESLLEEMSESIQKKYCGLKSRNRSELLAILQEVRYLFNNEIDDETNTTERINKVCFSISMKVRMYLDINYIITYCITTLIITELI
jgi:DNA anti-recombination protein RmuC